MYEERRDTFSIKDVLLEILLIILFVLILICIFPTKNHIKKLLTGNKTEEQTKVEASADDIDRLASLYNQVFATNIYNIKEAAVGYYTTERLPQTVGDSSKMTLEEMYNKHLILKVADKDGNYCDPTKSYVSITKYDNEYQMKINLSCDEEEDYIIVYLGCYDYCDASGVCEKKVTVKTGKDKDSIPSNSNNEPYIINSNNNDDDSNSNKTSNTVSNSNSNTTSNSNSNTTSNSNSNSNSNTNDDKCELKVRNNMTLFFDTVGGSKISSVSFCTEDGCEHKDIQVDVPTKEGYTFAGWYTDTTYKTIVNITSNKSENLKKLNVFDMVSVLDKDGCGRTDETFAVVYAKWIKSDEECPTIVGAGTNIVNYVTNGGSKVESLTVCKTCADATLKRNVPTSTREGYKFIGWYTDSSLKTKVQFESNGLPTNTKWTKVGCYDDETTVYAKWEKDTKDDKHEYACEYNISTKGSSSWGEWSSWSTEKVTENSDRQVETTVKKVKTGTKTEEKVVGTKYETYIKEYTTVTKKVGTTKETKKVGYKYEKVPAGTKTVKQKVGTKKVATGETITKTTYVKVPAGYKNIYVESGSGTTIPANTSEYTYVKKGSTTSQSCSGCVAKTVYTWDVYKKVIVYKAEQRTEQIPVYRTEDVYETKQVTVYTTKKVDVYETVETPVYETQKVPVYAVREVEIKDNLKIDVYDEVTYYRYRIKQYIGGATESVWSTCDPVDDELIKKGYKLTGNKREA